MNRLASLSARWWWAVLGTWAVLVVGLHFAAPPFSKVAIYDFSQFLGHSSHSVQGGTLLANGWKDGSFDRSLAIVVSRDHTRLGPQDEAYARDLVAWLQSPQKPPHIGEVTTHFNDPRLADTLASRDGQAWILRVTVNAQPSSPQGNKADQALLRHVQSTRRPPGLKADVTGPVAVLADQTKAIDDSVARTHLLALTLIVVILAFVYRSPVAMLVPLATIGVAFSVSMALISLLAKAGMDVSAMYQQFSTVVIFGIGTDYCLLLVSRYAEELTNADDEDSKALRTRTLTGTVAVLATVLASSAATVAVGFSAQGLAHFGLYRTLGPAMAIAVVITGLAALTLAPSLMRALGRNLFWPRHVTSAHMPASAELKKAA